MGNSIAVVPLTIPLLTGPASMSTVVIYADPAATFWQHLALVGYGVVVAAAVWASFSMAEPIARVLGKTGINVMTRLMGRILAALAVRSDGGRADEKFFRFWPGKAAVQRRCSTRLQLPLRSGCLKSKQREVGSGPVYSAACHFVRLLGVLIVVLGVEHAPPQPLISAGGNASALLTTPETGSNPTLSMCCASAASMVCAW